MKRVTLWLSLLPALSFLLTIPDPALAETATFAVNKDTFANSVYNPPLDYRDNNYGGTGSVVISNEPIDRLGYLQFENVELPEGAILSRGLLKFYVHEQSYSGNAKLNVGPVSSDWEETGLTWNNQPAINQSQAVEAEITLATGWKEITITHLVRQWFEGSLANKGIFIYPFGYLYGTSTGDFAFSLKSKESGNLATKLEVEYHFEPTPAPTSSPSPTPTPQPGEEALAPDTSPAPTGQTTPSPLPEESPSATSEAEEKPFLTLALSPGQAIIVGLILLALVGAVLAFLAYFRRQPKLTKKVKKKKKEETQEEEPS